MADPWHHAIRTARRFGGTPEDYLETHTWFDYTKSHLADCQHRLFLHNAWGIFVAERILGPLLTRASDNQCVPLRPILENHILEDFGKIPTLATCLAQLPPEAEDPDITVYEQCRASAARWGGVWADYQALHQFLDWPRDYVADGRYRRVLHNTWGVSMTVQALGIAYQRPSDGVPLAVQPIAEEHIRLERGTVPSLEACLEGITLERWMCARALPT
jgi:hypothetical protein